MQSAQRAKDGGHGPCRAANNGFSDVDEVDGSKKNIHLWFGVGHLSVRDAAQ